MPVDVEVEIEVAAAVPSHQETSIPSKCPSPAPASVAEPQEAVSDLPAVPVASPSHTEALPSQPSKSSHSPKSKPPAPLAIASGSSTRSGSPDENAAAAIPQVKAKSKGAEKQKSRPRDDGKPLQDQIDNSQLPSSSSSATHLEPKKSKKQSKARTSEAPAKRKAETLDDLVSDAPAPSKKRRQSSVPTEKVASLSKVDVQPVEDESEGEEDALPQPKVSSKGKRKGATSSKPTRAPSKPKRTAQLFAHESPQKKDSIDLVPEEIDAEIQGMIIECMATSRASSMPVSLVVRMVLQAHPRLKEQRAEKEWRKVVGRVLVNGMAGRGSGVFGKVDSSGKVSVRYELWFICFPWALEVGCARCVAQHGVLCSVLLSFELIGLWR
jgi:hypothetical protein